MTLFLIALKVAYVMDTPLPSIAAPKENNSKEIKSQHQMREKDEVICRGHIMDNLFDRLFDLFIAVRSPREIWTTLEYKYDAQKQCVNK